MNKLLLAAVLCGATAPAIAQRSAIRTAANHLEYKEYDKAIKAIEGAQADPSTKDDPKTWYTRGNIFYEMYNAAGQGSPLYREAATSYVRAAELNSKEDDLNQRLYAVAIYYFNDAQKAFREKKYDSSYALFTGFGKVHSVNNGTRFANNRTMDTIAANAKLLQGYSAYYLKNYDAAAPVFEEVKNNPIVREANTYLVLADIYKNQKMEGKVLGTLGEGRAAFPADQNLRNEEINYYMRSGRQAELMTKLEQAVSTDPNNAELLFNLGNGYMTMAFPKAEGGQQPARPAAYDSLVAKSERAFRQAVRAASDNPDYSYNLGALYYNQAAEFNRQINEITGTSTADLRKAEALKVQRDNLFTKAIPYLERSYSLIEVKPTKSEDEMITYRQSVYALREIYSRTNQAAKAEEMKRKYDAARN